MVAAVTYPTSNDDVMNPGDKPEGWLLPIQVTVTNRGKTPATVINRVVIYVSAATVDRNDVPLVPILPEIPPYKEPLGQRERKSAIGSICATEDKIYMYRAIPKDFLVKENAEWRRGERCLCVMGYVEYRDAFGKIRITRFCYAYQGIVEGGSFINAVTGKPVFLPEFLKVETPEIYNRTT
jgi:hypothetical protein